MFPERVVIISHSVAGSRPERHDAPEKHNHLRAGGGHRRRAPPRPDHLAVVQVLLANAVPSGRIRRQRLHDARRRQVRLFMPFSAKAASQRRTRVSAIRMVRATDSESN